VKPEPNLEIKPEVKGENEDKAKVKTEPGQNPNAGAENSEPPVSKVRRVYYCTRTHSQLKQVVDELRNCHPLSRSDVSMCVLGSRQHLCVNQRAKNTSKTQGKSLDEVCSEMMNPDKNIQDEDGGCGFGLNIKRVADTVNQINSLKVWDIEDAYRCGTYSRGCSYYATKSIFETANYIFSPYNYIIDPDIRRAMKIDLKDSIVIFDEAHNIEDVTREAASLESNRTQIAEIHRELSHIFDYTNFLIVKQLLQLVIDLLTWINDMSENLINPPAKDSNTFTTPFNKKTSYNSNYPNKTPAPSRYHNNARSEESFWGENENVWDGDEFVDIFEERFNVTQETLAVYEQLLDQIMKQSEENEGLEVRFKKDENSSSNNINQRKPITLEYEDEDGTTNEKEENKRKLKISVFTVAFIRKYLRIYGYLLKEKKRFARDFRIVIQKVDKVEPKGSKKRKSNEILNLNDYEITFNIWCLSGGVIFQEIGNSCHSVILTSGTLAPLDSFAGELTTAFPVRVEASHVINLSKQLKVGLISTFNKFSLNSTYTSQKSDEYLDNIGLALLSIAKETPGGTLMFLPSYILLNRLMNRWNFTKLMNKIEIETGANIYFEPKDSKEMKNILKSYYEDLSAVNSKAIMIGVCRGKVSEGINFSDHYARSVIVVGIPFPSITDLKITLKKKYQDNKCSDEINKNLENGIFGISSTTCSSTPMKGTNSNYNRTPYSTSSSSATPSVSNLQVGSSSTININGQAWYKQQAFRAINQAIGRCIRHKDDFGSIILLDPRFHQDNVVQYLSKWLRNEAVSYERLEDFLHSLRDFFQPLNSYEKVEKGLLKNPFDGEEDDESFALKMEAAKSLSKKNSKEKEKEKEKSEKEKEKNTKRKKDEVHVKNEPVKAVSPPLQQEKQVSPFEHFKFKEEKKNEHFNPMDIEEVPPYSTRKSPQQSNNNNDLGIDEISISQAFERVLTTNNNNKTRQDEIKEMFSQSFRSENIHNNSSNNNNKDVEFVFSNTEMKEESPFMIKTKAGIDFFYDCGLPEDQQDVPPLSFHLEDMILPQSQVMNEEMEEHTTAAREVTDLSFDAKETISSIESVVSVNILELLRQYLVFSNTSKSNTRQSPERHNSTSSCLIPLPGDLSFLKNHFQNGLDILEITILSAGAPNLLFQVLPSASCSTATTTFQENAYSVVEIKECNLSQEVLAKLLVSATLQKNSEKLRFVDHWDCTDGVVYRLLCYQKTAKTTNGSGSALFAQNVNQSHYQVVSAQIIATSNTKLGRGLEQTCYGNFSLLQSLLLNRNSSPTKTNHHSGVDNNHTESSSKKRSPAVSLGNRLPFNNPSPAVERPMQQQQLGKQREKEMISLNQIPSVNTTRGGNKIRQLICLDEEMDFTQV
jgi:Rad3-related DNA helicase